MGYPDVISDLLYHIPPGATDIEVSQPAFESGYWHIDFTFPTPFGTHSYVIQHKLGGWMGVSRLTDNDRLFTYGCDQVLASAKDLGLYMEQQQRGPAIVIHRTVNGQGETYSLAPESLDVLRAHRPERFNPRASVFLSRPERPDNEHVDLSDLQDLVRLLTGLGWADVGGVSVYNPVAEGPVAISP